MSASADLQAAIEAKLKAKVKETIGDGAATVFPIETNFGTKALYAVVKEGETTLVNGTDYSIALTDNNTVTITALTGAPGADAWLVKLELLRVHVEVVSWRDKELPKKIEAAAANKGLCIFVQPPLPTHCLQGGSDVFFDRAEVRVRIVEKPALNKTGADAYDLLDDVAACLHWQGFGDILSHPLQLAERPCEMVEDQHTRIIDVIFEAVYGLQPSTTETP